MLFNPSFFISEKQRLSIQFGLDNPNIVKIKIKNNASGSLPCSQFSLEGECQVQSDIWNIMFNPVS